MRACGKESDVKEKEGMGKREEGWKVMFWNIAGLCNKDKERARKLRRNNTV